MTFTQRLLCLVTTLSLAPAWSQPAETQAPLAQSALTGELLFEILLGELQVLQGDPGAGYSLLLDSARKTGDEALYERATEVALRSRAGDAALRAALAWRQAAPSSRKANLRTLQIQVALQRLQDVQYSLQNELQFAPAQERSTIILSVPSLLNRAADKRLAARVAQNALQPWLGEPDLGAQAWAALGQLRLMAQDPGAALEAARSGHEVNPKRAEPLWLALELARSSAEAMAWVELTLPKLDEPALNLGWARVLIDQKRWTQAESVLTERMRQKPEDPSPWLLLGAVRYEMKNNTGASEAWERFLKETSRQTGRIRDRDQALMGLAQIGIDTDQTDEALAWLARVSDADNLLRARVMRASILARQGKVDEGRMLIASLPVRTQTQERARTLAEIQFLREFKRWQAAYEVLQQALARADDDDDEMVYELAMAAEKVGRLQEMENLLLGLIERNPNFHHAYNALGFSWAERNVRLEEAKKLIVKALELAPDDPYITDSLGWVEFRLGHRQEALAILRRAYTVKPDAEIAAHLGEVLWSLEQKTEAMTVWREGLKLQGDHETLRETMRRLGAQP